MKFSEADKRFAREAVREAERAREVLAAMETPEARRATARRRRAYWAALNTLGERMRREREQREREQARAIDGAASMQPGKVREPGQGKGGELLTGY